MFSLFCSLLIAIVLSSNCDPPCETGICMTQTASVTGPDPSNPSSTKTASSIDYQCEENILCGILGLSGECKSISVTKSVPYVWEADKNCPITPLTFTIPITIDLASSLTCGGDINDCTIGEELQAAFAALIKCYLPDEVVTAIQCSTGTCPPAVVNHLKNVYPRCACNVLYPILQYETGYEYIPIVNAWIAVYVDQTINKINSYFANCIDTELSCDHNVASCQRPDHEASPFTDPADFTDDPDGTDETRRRLTQPEKCDEEDTNDAEMGYIEVDFSINVCVIDVESTRADIYNILRKSIVATFGYGADIVFEEGLVVNTKYSATVNAEGTSVTSDNGCELVYTISANLKVYWSDIVQLAKFYYNVLLPTIGDAVDELEDGVEFSVRFGEECLQVSMDESGAEIEDFGAVEVVYATVEIYDAEGNVYGEPVNAQGGVFYYSFGSVFAFLAVVIAFN